MLKTTAKLLAGAAILCAMAAAHGDPLVPDEGKPTVECRRCEGIVIDGKLDEAAWKDADGIGPFVYPWPAQTGPRVETRAAVLWDERYLYVAYWCEDGDITATHTERDDPTYKDDCVEIFIAPRPEKSRMYYGFELNARGVLYDYFYAFPDCLLTNFDTVGTRLKSFVLGTLNQSDDEDDGWTLEIAIPLANFSELAGKKRPEAGDVWRVNLNRWDGTGSDRAMSQWTPSGHDRPNPHRPEGFGALKFVDE